MNHLRHCQEQIDKIRINKVQETSIESYKHNYH